MHDTLPTEGMCDVSRDLFKCWEIRDNISLAVQDSCNGTLIHCGLSNGTIANDLE